MADIFGTNGDDELDGTDLADNIFGYPNGGDPNSDSGRDTLRGFGGDDFLYGGADRDQLYGGDGDDTLIGGEGRDILYGGFGSDVYLIGDASGPDIFLDERSSGAGGDIDTVRLIEDTSLQSLRLGSGARIEVLDLNGFTLTGTSGDDVFDLSGIHHIIGGPIDLGDGHNKFEGSFEDDFVPGGAGSDWFYGYAGDDTLNGGGGRDTLYGGPGEDKIDGGDGGDRLFGNSGDDFIDPGAGADQIDGGRGFDTVWYGDSPAGVTVNLLTYKKTGVGGDAEGDTYAKIEHITGSAYDDMLTGTTIANALKGGAGNDTIYGIKGRDTIDGQAGSDTLYGGAGNDVVVGGDGDDFVYGNRGLDKLDGELGNDELWGGNAADYFVFVTEGSNGFGQDIIRDFDDGADRIDVRGVHSTSDPSQVADTFSDFTVGESDLGLEINFEGGQVIYLDTSDNHMTVADITADDFVFA